MQRMEENNEVITVVDMRVPGKRPRGETKREMDGLRPKGYPGTAEDAQDRTLWKSRIRAADPT